MKTFKNMKMKYKVLLPTFVAITFVLISSIMTIIGVKMIDTSNDDQYRTAINPAVEISGIESEFLRLRIFVAKSAVPSEHSLSASNQKSEYNKLKNGLEEHINEFYIYCKENIKDQERIASLEEIRNLVINHYFEIGDKVIEAASRKDFDTAADELAEGSEIADNLNDLFVDLFDDSVTFLSNSLDQQSNLIGTISIFTIAFLIFIILVTIPLSLIVGNAVSRKIIKIAEAMKQVSLGNFDTSFISNDSDEIGDLSRNLGTVIETIHDIVSDVELLGSKQKEGELSYKIDENKYLGLYASMVSSVNNSFTMMVSDISEIFTTLGEFANGNFDAELRRFSGEKEKFNIAIERFRNNLKGINEGIGTIINNAAQGDLSSKIDSSQYQGDWKKLMDSLNELFDVINEPISESILVLQSLANGDLETRMVGNYNGEFELIKTTLNETIESLSGYIENISTTLGSIAKNDFTVSIEKNFIGDFDKIKKSINQIIDKLNEVFKEFLVGADEVSQGAQQISQSSIYLAEGATKQVSSLEELNAAVEIVNDKTKINATSAKEANKIASLASDNATLGDEQMKSMLVSMDEISASSNQIGKVIKVIEDIAFQTNLLALNAAVEAARAGAHGKGFAVVAEEVRSLAVRSQEAAKETTELIDTSISKVVVGSSLAKETAKALDEIVKNVSDVSVLIAGISEASQSQAVSMAEISRGLNEVESVIQNNSAAAEEGVSTAEELSSQSVVLRSLIGSYKLNN